MAQQNYGSEFDPQPVTNPYIPPVTQTPATQTSANNNIFEGGGAGGWWTAPSGGGGNIPTGEAWRQQMYSPEFTQGIKGMYGAYDQAIAGQPNLAGTYQEYLNTINPQLEQMTYNQALARIRGRRAHPVNHSLKLWLVGVVGLVLVHTRRAWEILDGGLWVVNNSLP